MKLHYLLNTDKNNKTPLWLNGVESTVVVMSDAAS
jgi:hypothetical protein